MNDLNEGIIRGRMKREKKKRQNGGIQLRMHKLQIPIHELLNHLS